MVDGFTKDGTFRPIRSPVPPPSLTARELLPKQQTKEEKSVEKERIAKFAEGRKKATKGARLAVGGAKAVGGLTRFGVEKLKQRGIEKSIREREFSERLDRELDRIVDDPNLTDSSKLRLIIRFARLNRRNFTKQQRNEISAINRELIGRIKESRSKFVSSPQGVGTGSGISQEEIAKLPQTVRSDIEKAVA